MDPRSNTDLHQDLRQMTVSSCGNSESPRPRFHTPAHDRHPINKHYSIGKKQHNIHFWKIFIKKLK